MRKAVLVAVMLLLAGCGSAADAPAPTGYTAEVIGALDTLNRACPGLKAYSSAVTTAGVEGTAQDGFTIQYVVTDASKLPSEFYAAGQNCYFQVGGQDPAHVEVGKKACASICLGTTYTGPPSTQISIQ